MTFIFITSLLLLSLGIFLLRKISPSFDAKIFYYGKFLQTFILYHLILITRPFFRNFTSPMAIDPEISPVVLAKIIVGAATKSDPKFKSKSSSVSIKSLKTEPLQGGFVGNTYRLHIEYQTPDETLPKSLVVKSVPATFSKHFASVMLGSAREALFYKDFSLGDHHKPLPFLPKAYFANGSTWTGDFIVIMEDLSDTCVAGGHLFGNQCWGPPKIPDHVRITPQEVLDVVADRLGDLHAQFWRDFGLLQNPSLKNTQWIQGGDRTRWEYSMLKMRDRWDTVKAAIKEKKLGYSWSQKMIDVMENAIRQTNWGSYRKDYDIFDPRTPFSLCHGDSHPGNMLWRHGRNAEEHHMYLIDFAEIGVFCPFTDLAQFVISHTAINVRRSHERKMFERYHARLISKGVSEKDFPLEECWDRYVSGGIERWLQMLLLLASLNFANSKALPDFGMTWFYKQVESFVEDHYDSSKRMRGLMSTFCLP